MWCGQVGRAGRRAVCRLRGHAVLQLVPRDGDKPGFKHPPLSSIPVVLSVLTERRRQVRAKETVVAYCISSQDIVDLFARCDPDTIPRCQLHACCVNTRALSEPALRDADIARAGWWTGTRTCWSSASWWQNRCTGRSGPSWCTCGGRCSRKTCWREPTRSSPTARAALSAKT
eukprot:1047860-Rhodomonas_salina.2